MNGADLRYAEIILKRLDEVNKTKLTDLLTLLDDELDSILKCHTFEFDSVENAHKDILLVVNHLKNMSNTLFSDLKYRYSKLNDNVEESDKSISIEKFLERYSRYESTLLHTLDTFILHTECALSQTSLNIEYLNSLFSLATEMSYLVRYGIEQEVLDTPKSVGYIMNRVNNSAVIATRKQSTEKARNKRQIVSIDNRNHILREYSKLKEKNPKISKDAAALEITNNTKINLSLRTIRKYLDK